MLTMLKKLDTRKLQDGKVHAIVITFWKRSILRSLGLLRMVKSQAVDGMPMENLPFKAP